MSTSSIDDLLMGVAGNSQQPPTPENAFQEEPEPIQENEEDAQEPLELEEEQPSEHSDEPYEHEESVKKKEPEVDEYGNEKEPENEAIRERLARQARKHQAEIDQLRAQLAQQGASPQVQQAAKDFEYNPEEGGDWQQQLASFVKQTVNSMTREQEETKSRHAEAQVQAEFETKFRDGMGRFDDFVDVVSNLPFEITNPMTLATRGMDNPAAFLYAAAKRNPQELERISKIRDPYAQMTEMGKLEERMRRNKPITKAPRPLGRTPEDATTKPAVQKVDKTGDDIIAQADAKRLATLKNRHRSNR